MKSTADERAAMRDVICNLLRSEASESHVRATMTTRSGYDAALWKKLADLGIIGMLIDPEYGGSGLGPIELELIMEETGSVLLCSPFLSSGVLAASLLMSSKNRAVQQRLLPSIADGTTLATVAMTDDRGCWTEAGIGVHAHQVKGHLRLNGVASYVLYGEVSDVFLVVARTSDGLRLYEVTKDDSRFELVPLSMFDPTLRSARLRFADTPARLIEPIDWTSVQKSLDVALIARAGEQVGGTRRIFDMTIAYSKTRFQFGRPIGGFQAMKHWAADLLIDVESSISAARYAADRMANQIDQSQEALYLAAFACSDAYTKISAATIQMHGGIGFTWEHPAHLYARRARAYAQLFGSPSYYREQYLRQLGA